MPADRHPILRIDGPLAATAAICEPILRALPPWFGIESAVLDYLENIPRLPTFLAHQDGQTVGFLTLRQHFPESAEIYVMGVTRPRRGGGKALLEAAQDWLRDSGTQYLQVKTLAASVDYPPYAQTRAFYQSQGFSPLEVLPNHWDEGNPCLLLVKNLIRSDFRTF